MRISISGEGHLSTVDLTGEQVEYLQQLLAKRAHNPDDIVTLAVDARWAIEQSRQAWQAEGR